LTPADRFTVPADVMARAVGTETVLLDLASGTYFGLDEVGTRVWELLQEGKALGDVCAAMASEFEAPPDEIESDVLELARNLLDRRLIQRA